MPIKEKSTFKKHEYEYESPDGDTYSIVYIESQDREYVEISPVKSDGTLGEKVVWDFDMFKDISDSLMKIKYGNAPPLSFPPGVRGLTVPTIVDHRLARADEIQQSVDDSMKKYDDSVSPIESFDTDQTVATGIDNSVATEEAEDTPEDLAMQGKPETELKSWQKDALRRTTQESHKDPAKIVRRRIEAGDLM